MRFFVSRGLPRLGLRGSSFSQCSALVVLVTLLIILSVPLATSERLHLGVLTAKQFWFLGSFALMLFVSGMVLIIRMGSRSLIRINVIDFMFILLAGYLAFSVAVHSQSILSNTRFVNLTIAIVLYFILRNFLFNEEQNESGSKTFFVLVILYWIVALACIEAVIGSMQLFGVMDSFHYNFNTTGTFGNPAPFAIFLAVIFPLSVSLHLGYSSRLCGLARVTCSRVSAIVISVCAYLPLATIVITATILPATMIRSAWLAAAVGGVISVWPFASKSSMVMQTRKFFTERVLLRIVAIGIVATLVVLLSVGMFTLKANSSYGKMLIWKVTSNLIGDHPFIGIGIGRYQAEYNDYQAQWFSSNPNEASAKSGLVAGNTKYAYNDLLEIAAELGVVALTVLATVALILYQRFRRPTEHRVKTSFSPTLRGCFAALLISMLISYPLSMLPIIVFAFVALAIHSSYTQTTTLIKGSFHSGLIGIILLFLGFSIGLYSYRQFKMFSVWENANKLYQTGNHHAACETYEQAIPYLENNAEFLQYYGKALLIDKQYEKSLETLYGARAGVSDVFLYTSLGDCHKALKEYEMAEVNYTLAANMNPGMLFPKYRLAQLYQETNERDKLRKVSEQIMEKETKINTQAVEEIKSNVGQFNQ